jgi:hypothetical protein
LDISILNVIRELKKLNGYLGAAIFAENGKMVGGVTEVLGMNFEIAGTLFNNIYIIAENMSKEAGYGSIDLVQLNSNKGVILCKTVLIKKKSRSIILVVEKGSNITLTKLKLAKIAESFI